MWIKKLKKKKFQYMLVTLMLCFTSAIFAACMSFVFETKKFTETYTSCENCPRAVAIADSKYDREYFEQYDTLMENTNSINYCDVTFISNSFYYNGKKIESYHNTAYHVKSIESFMHHLKMLEGEEKVPKYGEVWISSVCADSYGITIGDQINLGSTDGTEFTVSGIVATPICPSPYMGSMPYYICESSAELLDGYAMSGISFFSDSMESSDEYKKLLPEEFKIETKSLLDSAGIKLSISYLADIFGGIGLLAAVIIFVVSLIIIKFIIMSALAKEYREIGTYKALGFTDRQIVGFYLKSFVFAGGAGILIGAVLSFPFAQYLCNMVLRHLGTYTLSPLAVVLAAASVIILITMLLAGVFLSLRKIHKITPVDAFSAESISTKKKTGSSLIKNAYSPLAVAINDVARRKTTNFMIVLVLTVSLYMAMLFASVNYSVTRIGEMQDSWFAFPKYDASISMLTREPVEEFLEASGDVEKYVLANTDVCMSGLRTDSEVDVNNIYFLLFSDCAEDSIGLPLVEGRHPQSEDEILMSYDLSRLAGIQTGEWFHMENDEYSNDYLVTGLFSSMYDGGFNIIMDGEEYARYQRPDKYLNAMIFLKENVTYTEFEKTVKENLIDTDVSEMPPFLEGSVKSINSVSVPLTTMFVIIFSVFCILNIVNLLLMNNIESRRQYGILKALGFTNSYICRKNILRIAILTLIAATAAMLIQSFLSQKLFFTIMHVNGLIANPLLDLAITGILFALIMIVTILFALPMRKVAPTDLMEE